MRFLLLLAAAACSTAQAAPPPAPIVSQVDALLAESWAAKQITAAPAAGDGEYLRRVTLDLAGRVPTRGETLAYLDARDPDKKAQLVDRLLASPDWGQHMADIYTEMFVGRDFKLALPYVESIRKFIVDAFNANLPYDQFTTRVLTATGSLGEHGEVGFLLAHAARGGSPEAVAGATARIFLGLQLQCAQCHDHPYDKRYKQADFYGLVAFFARTRGRQTKDGDVKTLEVFDVPNGQALMKPHGFAQGATPLVGGTPTSLPERIVYPKFLGQKIDEPDREPRRVILARKIIGSDLFAKAEVNHAWALLFGRGLVDPWDDLGGEHDDGHPPLLNVLAADFVKNGYDVKRLYRTIALSAAYDRAAAGGSDAADQAFARAVTRPLAPEPLFRSLLGVTDIEKAARKYKMITSEELSKKIEQGLKQFLFVFGDDEGAQVDRFNGNMPQALLLFNGELTNLGTRATPGGALRAILDEGSDPTARITGLYLTALARRPSPAEVARFAQYVTDHGNKPATYEDLFYALLASTEFTTNH